jgi:hypothetical protein
MVLNNVATHSYRHCKDIHAISDLFVQNENQKVLKIKYFVWSLLYVVYSESLWAELVQGHVRERELLTLASLTPLYSIDLQ